MSFCAFGNPTNIVENFEASIRPMVGAGMVIKVCIYVLWTTDLDMATVVLWSENHEHAISCLTTTSQGWQGSVFPVQQTHAIL